MGDRLATIDMSRKEGGCCAPFGWELGLRLTQCGLAEAYLLTKWHLDPSSRLAQLTWAESGGGGCAPFWVFELGPI